MRRMSARWSATAMLLAVLTLPGVGRANSIASVTHDGPGCPSGSIRYSISGDGLNMLLVFDRFIVSTGQGIPLGEGTKDCRIDINMQASDGVRMNMVSLGYVELDQGIVGEQHQHVPRARRANQVLTFHGPLEKDYDSGSSATVPGNDSQAKIAFSILLKLDLDNSANPAGRGQMAIDSFDFKIVP